MTSSRITAIEPQARRQGRVNVYVDGRFALGLFEEVAQALGLHLGQPITEERLAQIARAETLRRAKEDAYRLLGFRARSEKEIADRLGRKGYEEEVVAEVLAALRAHGYVDDAAFAEAWVSARGGTRGRRALAHELRQKGVAPEVAARTIDEAKDEEAERAAAYAAAVKKVGSRPADQSRAARARLAAFLQRRGFGWDVIRPALRDLYQAGDEDTEEIDE
jgi:regulatory protein